MQLAAIVVCACCVWCAGCAASGKTTDNGNIFADWKIDKRSNRPVEPVAPQVRGEAYVLVAGELEQAGHLREAALVYERARIIAPQHMAYAPKLAALYDKAGDLNQAAAAYRETLAKNPRDSRSWNDYGYVCFRQQNLAEAERAFRESLAIAPTNAQASLNLGQTLANAGRFEEAYQAMAPVVGPAQAHANVAAIHAAQGNAPAVLAASASR